MKEGYHYAGCEVWKPNTTLEHCTCAKLAHGLAAQADLNKPEPAPIPNALPAVWDLVMQDMLDRDHVGCSKYGTRLQPNNGRDALTDAYQEALDLCVYLRQALYEKNGS